MMPPTITSIPASGGVISFMHQQQGNLSFRIVIPDKFFNSTQTVTVNMLEENAIQADPKIRGFNGDAQIAGPVFEIQATSLSSNGSATLFLPYRSAKSKRGDDTYVFRIYHFDDFNDIWISSESSADDKNSLTVSAKTSHFSLWAVISTKLSPTKTVDDEMPTAVDWRLALYIGLPCLGLLVVFFIARLMYAKHKHVQNSRYEFVPNMALTIDNCL
jgi:hypothetical protein